MMVAVAAVLAFATLADATAQTVRGRIVFPNNYPVNGAGVRVWHQNMGASNFAYTGYDGMYYLNGIPPGDYELQIFFNGSMQFRRPIRVFQQPMTDIGPIQLRF